MPDLIAERPNENTTEISVGAVDVEGPHVEAVCGACRETQRIGLPDHDKRSAETLALLLAVQPSACCSDEVTVHVLGFDE